MTPSTKTLLEQVASWPAEDQDELAEYAREIQAHRTQLCVMTAEERVAVQEGLEQAQRGEFVPDEDMQAFWKRCGVL